MNKEQYKKRSSTETGRVWAGIIIVGIGTLLLADKLNFGLYFPSWLVSVPTLLIVIGLIVGGKSNFKNPTAYILLIIGGFLLINRVFHFNLKQFIFPGIVIGIGLWLLVNRNKRTTIPGGSTDPRFKREDDRYGWDKRMPNEPDYTGESADYDKDYLADQVPDDNGAYAGFNETRYEPGTNFVSEDYVNSTAIFSESKKVVISKNFLGGEITNVFGGTDINLIQSDLRGPVVIDIFQIFGGTKIIVPSHWKIQSDVVSIFGEVDDRRYVQGGPQDDRKTVLIKGTSIFGGVTIKNI